MAKGWTEERRKKQAETIRKHRPWEQSTGPKTEEGKERCALNAIKHGQRCRIDDEYRQLFRMNREFVRLASRIAKGDPKTLRKTSRLLLGPEKP